MQFSIYTMSADYWLSSQRMHFQYTKDQLNSLRFNILLWEKQKVTNNSLMIRYDTSMRIFIHHMIARLGRRLSLRQIILSTAEVYISRFLIKVSLLEINIYMLVATSVYVACKICESPQHIRTILAEARNCWPEFISGDFTKIAEFEFYLIEELDCYLIVHHPYNSLAQLVSVLGKATDSQQNDADSALGGTGNDLNDERNCQYRLNLTDSEIESVWQVINDSYMTDLPLLYPPHIIAIAALHMFLTLRVEGADGGNGDTGLDSAGMFPSSKKGLKGSNGDPLLSFILDSNGKSNAMGASAAGPAHNDSSSNSNTPGAGGTHSSSAVAGGGGDDGNLARRSNSNSNGGGKNAIGLGAKGATYSQLGMRRKLSQSMSHTGRVLPRSGSAGASTTTAGNMAMSLSPEKSAGGRPGAAGAPPVWNARLDAFTNFLAGSNVNLEEVIESVQELLNLYEAWQAYDEGAIRQTVKNVLMTLHTRAAGLSGNANIAHPSSLPNAGLGTAGASHSSAGTMNPAASSSAAPAANNAAGHL